MWATTRLQNRPRKLTEMSIAHTWLRRNYNIYFHLLPSFISRSSSRRWSTRFGVCTGLCTQPADCLPNDQHACQGSGPGALRMAGCGPPSAWHKYAAPSARRQGLPPLSKADEGGRRTTTTTDPPAVLWALMCASSAAHLGGVARLRPPLSTRGQRRFQLGQCRVGVSATHCFCSGLFCFKPLLSQVSEVFSVCT